jgi:alcohol dehydrogenase class IV
MALAHCGLGAAHALAGPLGGSFPVPHGVACAATIPHAMRMNVRLAAARGDRRTLGRYADVARALGASGADDAAVAQAGVAQVEHLCTELEVPKLAAFGVTAEAIPELAAKAMRTSSMKANPVDLDEEDLVEILRQALA